MAASRKPTTTRESAPERNPSAPTIKQKIRAYDDRNRELAEIVLLEPDRYAYAVTWAWRVLERTEERCSTGRQKTLPLTTES